MRARKPWAGILAVVFVVWAGACGGTVAPTIGSETNWIGGCTADEQCASGACVCGVCTTRCDESTACRGDGSLQICVRGNSTAFDAACAGAGERPSGICLHRCTTERDCDGASECLEGACVRRSVGSSSAALLIGDACIVGDELVPEFPGYTLNEGNIENHSTACGSGYCVVHNLQGRASCPYGQPGDPSLPRRADPAKPWCKTPDGEPVVVPVEPQLVARPASDAVLCSCHCDGPEGTGPFCACPMGFECAPITPPAVPTNRQDLVGSYCIKAGTHVTDPDALRSGPTCDATLANCGPP